jgi:hypothetical protein
MLLASVNTLFTKNGTVRPNRFVVSVLEVQVYD